MEMSRTILVIDDDIDFQFMIGNALEQYGYMVKSLLEGKVSVAMNIAKTCDLILLDIELPGSNGVEIGQMLKSQNETLHIPVIVLSGHNEVDRLSADCQANDYIQKPFSLSWLVNKINHLLAPSVNDYPHDPSSAGQATDSVIKPGPGVW
jgi:DNA-binding response OmpR family regulator